jgi:hypothetical protein
MVRGNHKPAFFRQIFITGGFYFRDQSQYRMNKPAQEFFPDLILHGFGSLSRCLPPYKNIPFSQTGCSRTRWLTPNIVRVAPLMRLTVRAISVEHLHEHIVIGRGHVQELEADMEDSRVERVGLAPL